MRAWALAGVGGRLLVALALTVPGALGAVRAETYGQMQPASEETLRNELLVLGFERKWVQSPPIRLPSVWDWPPESDRIERLFDEYGRLTRGLEPKRMQTVGPDFGAPKPVRTITIRE
jgi:hypothetical protein